MDHPNLHMPNAKTRRENVTAGRVAAGPTCQGEPAEPRPKNFHVLDPALQNALHSPCFISYGTLFAAIGFQLLAYQRTVNIVLGIITIAVGCLVQTLFYCLGLGLPFIGAALAYRRMIGATRWMGIHHGAISRIGGGLMIIVGILLLSGIWQLVVTPLQQWTQLATPSPFDRAAFLRG